MEKNSLVSRVSKLEFILLLIILAVGAFLRLYKIDQYMTFLGDEGRDVIVVRRLLVNFDPILIGPGTSIGNMYLGPLYYYLMAPSLWLAGFSPVGPAVQIALLGVATIFMVWWVGREWFGPLAALAASAIYAVSPTVIVYSRSSWNPNIMPFFALLTIWSIWKVWSHSAKARLPAGQGYAGQACRKWLIILGISYAFVLQSHYLGLLLLPTIVIFWWLSRPPIRYSLLAILLFAFLMSPLVIFDARHGWRNFASMKKFFSERQTTVSARPWNAIPKMYPIFEKVNTRLIAGKNETAGKLLTVGIVLSLLWLMFFKKPKIQYTNYYILISWFGFAILGLGLYKQEIYDHYFGFFFPVPFLLIGALASQVSGQVSRLLLFLAFGILIFVNLKENPLKYPPNQQLRRAREVAQKIAEESKGERFNLAVIAERNYEDGYQYFLEKDNLPVVDIDAQVPSSIADQLFVVCEMPKDKCDPTHSPKAEVANFGWSKIESQWEVFGVTIYKLIHTK